MATAANELDYRPSYLAALIVSAAALLLYLVTLSPSTAMWDTSEYIAAAYTLGLPHPPGNPLFVLIGRVFSIIPLFGPNVATRINVLAALCSAVSAGMWFLTTERVLNELRNTVPLSRSRREYVEKFRQYAKGRFLPAR